MKDSPFFDKLIVKSDSELDNMLQNERDFDSNAIKVAKYIQEERANCVDYTTYSLSDLMDVSNHINKEKYPVRLALLENEIRKRKQSEEYFIEREKESNIKSLKDTLSQTNLRPDITIKNQDFNLNKLNVINISELPELFKDSHRYKYFTIEDSSIKLIFDFRLWRHEYGFKFFYYDKVHEKKYRSILHGMNNSFASEFAKEFLINGKKALDKIEWLEIVSNFMRFAKTAFYLFLTLILFGVEYTYQNSSPIFDFLESNLLFAYIFENQRNIFYLLGPLFFFFVYSDRKQLIHFNKLTGFEKFDTLMMFFMLLLLIAVLFL